MLNNEKFSCRRETAHCVDCRVGDADSLFHLLLMQCNDDYGRRREPLCINLTNNCEKLLQFTL